MNKEEGYFEIRGTKNEKGFTLSGGGIGLSGIEKLGVMVLGIQAVLEEISENESKSEKNK